MSSALAIRDPGSVADGDALLRSLAADLEELLDPVAAARKIGFVPDPWQRRVLETTKRKTIILCSRQSGKSTSSAFKAADAAAKLPNFTCLIISPGERQSGLTLKKAKDFYRQMGEPAGRRKWNDFSIEFENGSGIYALPGSEDTIRGFSAVNMILVDEASRVPDATIHAVSPMLAVSNGELILMSTPFGKRGYFYEQWMQSQHDPAWERIGPIVATDIPRISAEFLAGEQKMLPRLWYQQEYFCEFLEGLNSVFSLDEVLRAMSDATVEPLFAMPGITAPIADATIEPLPFAF